MWKLDKGNNMDTVIVLYKEQPAVCPLETLAFTNTLLFLI